MTAVGVSEYVGFEIHEGVAILELRRPEKRNAMTADMWRAILSHLDAASGEPDIRALVVQGVGGVFCAGADLKAVKDSDGSTAMPYRRLALRGIEAIAAFPVPTLARVDGPCVGAGCSLALACDLRFAHPDAIFVIPAVRHGIAYDDDSITRMVALVGPSRAARMLYAAEPVDAQRALSIGLVDECTRDLDAMVSRFLDAVHLGDPRTIAATRKTLRAVSSSCGRRS